MLFFLFKKDKLQTQMFGQEGSATRGFLYKPVFSKMWKVIISFLFWGQILVAVQRTLQIDRSAPLLKQKNDNFNGS